MDKSTVVLKENHRPKLAGSTRRRDVDGDLPIEITVELRGPKVREPGARPLSKASFAKKFGASRADANQVTRVLAGFGLQTAEVCLATRTIRVRGSAAQIEAAFKPNLGIYSVDKKPGLTGGYEFRGREGDLHIPAALDNVVLGVFGLDERSVARRHSLSAVARPVADLSISRTARQVEEHYNFPDGDGAGQHIAIAEFGGAYLASDLKAYCRRERCHMPGVTNIYDGREPPFSMKYADQYDTDWTSESMLDVEMVAGLCPRSNITIYWANPSQKGWTDMLKSVFHAVPSPVALAISWGKPEESSDFSRAGVEAINRGLKALAHLGITVCVASGDHGSGDGLTDGKEHVDFPASSPYVLAVGGTKLDDGGEAAWNVPEDQTLSDGGASGGGVSSVFPRPRWQRDIRVSPLDKTRLAGRVVPDVAALAGNPQYETIIAGVPSPGGGTSAAAPVWAALIARVNAKLPAGKRQRFLTPLLYRRGPDGKSRGSAVCKDISIGTDNASKSPGRGYPVCIGYDAVTGWGAPDGKALLKSLNP